MTGLIVESPEPGVALVVMDGAGRLNPLDDVMLRAMPGLLETLAGDPEVRVVVLTGAGGAFSAGGDLSVVGGLPALSGEELEAKLLHCFGASAQLHSMNKPTIAAISGPAAGGALGLALACDVRLVSADAAFVSPFVNMGLTPDYGVSWLLPRVVGFDVALEMALTGRRVGAEEARATGLATRVCDEPLAEALVLAGRIAAQPAFTVAATKRLMREVASSDLRAALRAEAREQSSILRSEEFLDLWETWRAEICGMTGRSG